jgi:hypothetical protein
MHRLTLSTDGIRPLSVWKWVLRLIISRMFSTLCYSTQSSPFFLPGTILSQFDDPGREIP